MNLVTIPYRQSSIIKLYVYHDSRLVAYEIIEPSLRSNIISVANLDLFHLLEVQTRGPYPFESRA